MLHTLQHPCIVALLGISIHPLCFALELAPLGSLNTVLAEHSKGKMGRLHVTNHSTPLFQHADLFSMPVCLLTRRDHTLLRLLLLAPGSHADL